VPTTAPDALAAWLVTQRELSLLMAHDLRNPLAAILANLNFLEIAVPEADGEVLEAMGDIRQSAETLLRLIENVATIARLEAGGALDPEDVATVDLALAVQNGFERGRALAGAAGVELELALPGSEAPVRGDQALLEQLVENLLINVAQHVRRGQRARIALTPKGESVVLTLDDDGPAFGDVARDFGRDGQLELKKRTDGRYSRGLSLYVVGLIARALDAAVAVRGDDGRGHLEVRFPGAAP
jgi:signal transduction histidine kinase